MNNIITTFIITCCIILITLNVVILYSVRSLIDSPALDTAMVSTADGNTGTLNAAAIASNHMWASAASGTAPTTTKTSPDFSLKTSAWIYPGNPACSASTEYADARTVDILKPEFFSISGGILTLLDSRNTLCNGYSRATIAHLKKYSREQYVTVSSASSNDIEAFLNSAVTSDTDISTLVDFVVANDLTGIELDFEDFGSWSPSVYASYKQFVTALGDTLHTKGKKLMLDGPAISSAEEANWFVWRYADFIALPVDHMVIMAYDYQFDHGAGSPIAPLDWIHSVITFTSSQYPKAKITIGLPSYGYQGTQGSYRMTILTNEQIKKKPGYTTATRDVTSGEMTWQSGTTVYFYNDSVSLKQKRDLVTSLGISTVSVWHLGGNLWF